MNTVNFQVTNYVLFLKLSGEHMDVYLSILFIVDTLFIFFLCVKVP